MMESSICTTDVDVLVVDDVPDNLRLIYSLLKDRDYSVRLAPGGELALRAAKAQAPDVILMDINMPGMDGYETCRTLKKDEDLADIPVIFLSALESTVDKVKAFESGAVDYVTKPFKIEELVARISTHVSLRRLRSLAQEQYEKLLKSETLRKNLVQMIVHDLRNPVSVIIGALDYNRHTLADGQPCDKDFLDAAFDQANLVNEMITQMLDIARIEDGKMPLQIHPASTVEVVEEATASVPGKAEVPVTVDTRGAPEYLHCDPKLIRRVLTNLLGNAVKFTPPDGNVHVRVSQDNGSIRFEVRDTGPGISSEHHDRIFEKFGQVTGNSPSNGHSTGLGLTFCRLAVEAHSGEIGVESEPGNGSLFWFSLPGEPALTLPS